MNVNGPSKFQRTLTSFSPAISSTWRKETSSLLEIICWTVTTTRHLPSGWRCRGRNSNWSSRPNRRRQVVGWGDGREVSKLTAKCLMQLLGGGGWLGRDHGVFSHKCHHTRHPMGGWRLRLTRTHLAGMVSWGQGCALPWILANTQDTTSCWSFSSTYWIN